MTMDLERKKREDEAKTKADDYHKKKEKEFDVYGKPRDEIEPVSSIIRPVPEKILNTK
jgi:hypothetical protein